MLGIFKKKTARQKLEEKYQKLAAEAYKLSHTDRKQSDLKQAEAEKVMLEIVKIDQTAL